MEIGYNESFNGKLRDELPNTQVFTASLKVQILTEQLTRHYNTKRQRSALGYKSLAPEAILPRPDPSPYPTLRPPRQGDLNSLILS